MVPGDIKKLLNFRLIHLMIVFLAFTFLAGCSEKEKTTLNIFAAAGLIDALNEINAVYSRERRDLELLTNFAASGDLMTQIKNGAPADLYITAYRQHLENLESEGYILNGSSRKLLTNKLVLIYPDGQEPELKDFYDLLKPEIDKIAIGDPSFVPIGIYAMKLFNHLEIPYDLIEEKIVYANNVRQVLSYVESGSADAGLVYLSDTLQAKRVKVAAVAPDEINREIIFPAAVIASTVHREQALDYLDFLQSDQAALIFEKHGFSVIGQEEQ